MNAVALAAVIGHLGKGNLSPRSVTFITAPRESPPPMRIWSDLEVVTGRREVRKLGEYILVVDEAANAYVVSPRIQPLLNLRQAAEILPDLTHALSPKPFAVSDMPGLKEKVKGDLATVLPLHESPGPSVRCLSVPGVIVTLRAGNQKVTVNLDARPTSGLNKQQRRELYAGMEENPIRYRLQGDEVARKIAADQSEYERSGPILGYRIQVARPASGESAEIRLVAAGQVVKDLALAERRTLADSLKAYRAELERQQAWLFGGETGQKPTGPYKELLLRNLHGRKDFAGFGSSDALKQFLDSATVEDVTPSLGVSLCIEPDYDLIRVPIYP